MKKKKTETDISMRVNGAREPHMRLSYRYSAHLQPYL